MFEFFKKFPEVLAVMSDRTEGSMKLFPDKEINLKNRNMFFRKAGADPDKVFAAEIVHGKKVKIIKDEKEKIATGSDGLLTNKGNTFLSVTIADCIPVFLYEPEKKIVGILHCGWRGIIAGIVPEAIEKMLKLDGSLENTRVALGPGIEKCHFEIREDILDNFRNHQGNVFRREGRIFVDLKGIITKQLLKGGIREENIENNDICTFENGRLFSFRREHPEIPEAMIALIGIKE